MFWYHTLFHWTILKVRKPCLKVQARKKVTIYHCKDYKRKLCRWNLYKNLFFFSFCMDIIRNLRLLLCCVCFYLLTPSSALPFPTYWDAGCFSIGLNHPQTCTYQKAPRSPSLGCRWCKCWCPKIAAEITEHHRQTVIHRMGSPTFSLLKSYIKSIFRVAREQSWDLLKIVLLHSQRLAMME